MSESFEITRFGADTPLLFICDHATNIVPSFVNGGALGVDDADMSRHIAYDIGAREVTFKLAERFKAPAIMTRFSRLVIDPNRGEDDPTLIMKLYDRTVIPANRDIDASAREERLARLYRPYHNALQAEIEAIEAKHGETILVSIHSFTKQLAGKPPRPWQIGLLSAEDRRLTDFVMQALEGQSLTIGDNEPYAGKLPNDTMDKHALRQNRHHTLVEFRNDLIADEAGQAEWAEIFGAALETALPAISGEMKG